MKIKTNHIVLAFGLFIGLSASAQRFTVESMKMELEDHTKPDSDKDYAELLKWAGEAKAHPKTANDPKMWYYRGLTYLKLANQNNELTKANPDALNIALISFNKAIETDIKNKVTKESKANLLNVAIGLYNSGYKAYQAEDYAKSYEEFSKALPLMEYDVDGQLKRNNLTAEVLQQMMAFSAMNSGDNGKAKGVLKELIDNGSSDPNIFANLAKIHLQDGDTVKSLEVVEAGLEMSETDKTLTNMKLDIYLKQGRSKELISELNEAIESDPGNVIYYFARAISFEGLGEIEKASADYDKIMEIDPYYYDAAYNKGVMHLNEISRIVDELDGVYDQPLITKKEAEIAENYKKAISKFKYVFENNDQMPIADKVELAGTMKKIYARLQQMDKYAEMKAFLEANK